MHLKEPSGECWVPEIAYVSCFGSPFLLVHVHTKVKMPQYYRLQYVTVGTHHLKAKSFHEKLEEGKGWHKIFRVPIPHGLTVAGKELNVEFFKKNSMNLAIQGIDEVGHLQYQFIELPEDLEQELNDVIA